ncbi:MAG: DMT family transporter [bacterium]|nr:DMT family transporter [bacterium]
MHHLCTFFFCSLIQNIKVHIALFTVALIYGITFSLVKDIMPFYLQGFGFIVLRVGGAAILFLGTSLTRPRESINWKAHGGLILSCSVFGVAANMLMFFKGLEITTPINGAVLMLATPIFVLILNTFIFKQQLTFLQLLGILTACAGAILLMIGRNFTFSTTTMPGDILIILNAISYAIYLVLVKKLLTHYHTLTVSKFTFLIGFVFILPFGIPELIHSNFNMPTYIIVEILFIIVCTTFVTYLLNAWAINKVGPTLVGAYIYLQPVLAAIIAIILQKDILTLQKVIATLLIFAGVYITSLKYKWYKLKA